MTVKTRKSKQDLAAREAQLQLREIQVEIRETELSKLSRHIETVQLEHEMLRRSIEVASNAVGKIPSNVSEEHQNELLGLISDAVAKLKKSIADNL